MSTEMNQAPLWYKEGLELPYVGVYGEINTGKTLFLLGIRPRSTCYIGLEFSATTYVKEAKVKAHHEIHEELGLTRDQVSPVDIWRWFEKFIREMPENEFEVLAIDTIGDLEQGLPEHVAGLYKSHGYSSADKFRAAKGLFWGSVKKYLESLMHFVRVKKGIKTIVWAAHLKTVWEGGSPTSQKTNQGYDIWMKTASLVFELKRPVKSGVKVEVPAGILRKGRLSVPKAVDSDGNPVEDEFGEIEWVTVLPPQMPKCTPGQIRRYIAQPAYSRALKAAEKVKEETLTEDQKLLIEQDINRNKVLTAEKQQEMLHERQAQQKRAEARLLASRNTATPPKPVEQPPAQHPLAEVDTREEEGNGKSPVLSMDAAKARIAKLMTASLLTKSDAVSAIKEAGGEKLADLDQDGLAKLDKILDGKEWNGATLQELESSRGN